MNETNFTNSTTTSKPGLGGKVKGAFEVIHGFGEIIRGTALGAVDTMSKKGVTKNDDIALQGRLEVERGRAKMGMAKSGHPVNTEGPTESNSEDARLRPHPSTIQQDTKMGGHPDYSGDYNGHQTKGYGGPVLPERSQYERQNLSQGEYMPETAARSPPPQGTLHPYHHRDDEVTNPRSDQSSVPNQLSAASTYDADKRPY